MQKNGILYKKNRFIFYLIKIILCFCLAKVNSIQLYPKSTHLNMYIVGGADAGESVAFRQSSRLVRFCCALSRYHKQPSHPTTHTKPAEQRLPPPNIDQLFNQTNGKSLFQRLQPTTCVDCNLCSVGFHWKCKPIQLQIQISSLHRREHQRVKFIPAICFAHMCFCAYGIFILCGDDDDGRDWYLCVCVCSTCLICLAWSYTIWYMYYIYPNTYALHIRSVLSLEKRLLEMCLN